MGSLSSNVADVGKSICGGALGAPSAGLGFSQPGYMCFVGFEIAFDGVTQGFLWGSGGGGVDMAPVQPVAKLIHFQGVGLCQGCFFLSQPQDSLSAFSESVGFICGQI